ncbi:MAG: hypothetical protein EGP73_02210 [Alistipes indistinctus]|nr:hypothetical protein [Alistipes indistinctus]
MLEKENFGKYNDFFADSGPGSCSRIRCRSEIFVLVCRTRLPDGHKKAASFLAAFLWFVFDFRI